jgi:hypothetical protein
MDVVGAAGAKSWFEEQATWTRWESEVHGVLDMGPSVVLAKVSLHFRGRGSGVEGDQDMWLVMTLKSGKIIRTSTFTSPHEAAEAVAQLAQ